MKATTRVLYSLLGCLESVRPCTEPTGEETVDLAVRGHMLRWVVGFISERFGRVRCNEARSRYSEYQYGLPQGSCLSPILFNVFFRDMFEGLVLDPELRVAVYADDICVTAVGTTVEAAVLKLSQALGEVEVWGQRNRTRFDK